MKVLVCGSRDWVEKETVIARLCELENEYESSLIIIQGGAGGVDIIAKNWAHDCGIMEVQVDSQWKFYTRAAGPIRNRWMLRLEPDLILAYPIHPSRGTKNMVMQAVRAGIKVEIYDAKNND